MMRKQSPIARCLVGLSLAWGALTCVPAGAETLEELDALSDQSVNEQAGIQMAREQAARGEYLEALATLERVLAAHPKSRDARLIHAIYLCQVDDRRGGLVEIGKLRARNYADGMLDEARAMCGQGR